MSTRDFEAEKKEHMKQVAALEQQILKVAEDQDTTVVYEALLLALHRTVGFSHLVGVLNR